MTSSIIIDKSTLPLNHVIIEEGSAYMIYDNKEDVFYNKVQVLNRDLSIQVIKLFSEILIKERNDRYQMRLSKKVSVHKDSVLSSSSSSSSSSSEELIKPPDGITILDALAATGLRSIRYMKEIPNIRSITINDLSIEATKVALNNIIINKIDQNKCIIYNKDATILMYESRCRHDQYDVIDIDPYGSASQFLDSAVQAVSDGGLLCITCTDTSVLCGTYPEVCYAKYGSMPLKHSYIHEGSLRILLNSIETVANKYKRYIEPWLSLSVDFYIRVFVRIHSSPSEVKNSCLKKIMIYQSLHCPTFYSEPLGTKKIINKMKKYEKYHYHGKHAKNNNIHEHPQDNDCDPLDDNRHINDDDNRHNHDNDDDNNDNRRMKSSNDFSFMNNNQSTLLPDNIHENGTFQPRISNISSNCPDCGSKWRIGGPYWGQSMYKQDVIDEILLRVEKSIFLNKQKSNYNRSKVHSPPQSPVTSTTTAIAATDTTLTAATSTISAATSTTTTTSCDYTHIPTGPRLAGLLSSMSEELKDVPLFYSLSELTSTLHLSAPPYDEVKYAIINAGYRISQFHQEPLAIKTDAPSSVVR